MSKIRKIIGLKTFDEILKEDKFHFNTIKQNELEESKIPKRYDLINYLLSRKRNTYTSYLEIGVRNPEDNFNKIIANNKYSVDPGLEFKKNPVDFKVTSDDFFDLLNNGSVLDREIKFDVIFIDGLHTSNQVYKDIQNSLNYLTEDGFIVIHDCNPPTEWHARETQHYLLSPARNHWNGTVWKALYKFRFNTDVSVCCIDSDWGLGVISKRKTYSSLVEDINPFLEYKIFDENRKISINLIDFETFKKDLQ